jgi:hypothetical protein
MGKNIQYGEFTFAPSTSRPAGKSVSTAKSTKGIPKSMYGAPHAMKDGGYAKGGAKREPESTVRKEVALLSKAGAPKAMISHEKRELKGEKDTPKMVKAEVGMLRKAKAPLTMIKEEMMEPTGMKKGGSADSKLKKHANMPAAKAHGPGAGNRLAKGGVPTFSKTPKIC